MLKLNPQGPGGITQEKKEAACAETQREEVRTLFCFSEQLIAGKRWLFIREAGNETGGVSAAPFQQALWTLLSLVDYSTLTDAELVCDGDAGQVNDDVEQEYSLRSCSVFRLYNRSFRKFLNVAYL